jgi:hypothetical protein
MAGCPLTHGVPPELSAAVKDLCAHYSTPPGQADADLVERLGLFEYLARGATRSVGRRTSA